MLYYVANKNVNLQNLSNHCRFVCHDGALTKELCLEWLLWKPQGDFFKMEELIPQSCFSYFLTLMRQHIHVAISYLKKRVECPF